MVREEHERVLVNLSETINLIHSDARTFTFLSSYLSTSKRRLINGLDYAWYHYKTLHQWISNFTHKLKYLRKMDLCDWPDEFYCPDRHTIAHHRETSIHHRNCPPSIVDVRIGSSSRVPAKQAQHHDSYLAKLNQLAQMGFPSNRKKSQKDLKKWQESTKDSIEYEVLSDTSTQPSPLQIAMTKPQYHVTYNQQYDRPHILHSIGSSTLIPIRFGFHSANVSRRKNLSTFEGKKKLMFNDLLE